MSILDPELEQYLGQLQKTRDPLLMEMEARAHSASLPIMGPLVGRLCQQVAQSVNARDVFEMGSGIGYSTWWFAQAVGEGGRVVHTDDNGERTQEARHWLDKANLLPRVHFETGDALEILKKYPGPFDVVFIDVEKHGYPEALELARSRVRAGGYIICDHVLWAKKVLLPPSQHDRDVRGMLQFNKEACGASDLLTTIVPLRDGVALSLKLPGEAARRRR